MTAFEAAQLTAKAKANEDMPIVYKQIKEAAEKGKSEIFFSKYDVNEIKVNILKTKGYKVVDEWEERHSQASDVKTGYKISW